MAKRQSGRGNGESLAATPRRTPRGASAVIPGKFGDHADRACREWLADLGGAQMGDRATLTGRLESAVLLVVDREAVLESVCLPDGACRFRFVGALRLLAHRIERGMVEDDE